MLSTDQIDVAELSDAIGAIYDCAIDPAGWPTALGRMAALLDASTGLINVYDYVARSVRIGARFGGDDAWFGERLENVTEDLPLYHTMHNADLDGILCNERFLALTGNPRLFEGRFFTEWAFPAGYLESITWPIARTDRLFGAVSFLKPKENGLATPRELEISSLLAPHVRRAVTISDLLDMRAVANSRATAALDALTVAVVAVDGDARIIHANAAAERLLERGTTIRIVSGLLQATDQDGETALRKAISSATEGALALGAGGIGLPLRSPDLTPAVAYVLPLATGSLERRFAPRATAAIFLAPAERSTQTSAEILAGLFGLSPKAARVALAVADNDGRQAAADAIGLGYETVKSHLAAIYEKTGTRNQGELKQLVERLRPPIR